MKRSRTIALLTLASATVLGSGCASYYAVTDSASGKTYYTTEKPRRDGGALVFTASDGGHYNLSSAGYKTISKSEYESGTGTE